VIKADLHIHTCYSPDSRAKIPDIIKRCLKIGLGCIAITDHNTIKGALEAKEEAPFLVIVGEEIRTREGEIIGYFLQEEIPPGLSPEETARLIKEQGGLVCIPHPFDSIRRSSALKFEALCRIIDQVDIIEAFNARTFFPWDRKRALKLAEERNLPVSAGSDAHHPSEIGRMWMELPPFENSPRNFLEALRRGRARGEKLMVLEFLGVLARRAIALARRC